MKRLFYFGILALLICAVFGSCTSERLGCPATHGIGGTH